jgi:hypothetical protein
MTVICAQRVQTVGAFSTHETTKLFDYAKRKYHTDPGSMKLDHSYKRWAVNVSLSVMSSIILGPGLVLRMDTAST